MKPLNINFIACWLITVSFNVPGLSNAEAADYFPLQVGNSWTYSSPYGSYGNRVDSIIGTETINGTLTYIWNSQDEDNYIEKRWVERAGNDLRMHKIWNNEGVDATFTPALTVGKLNPSLGETYAYELDLIVDGVSVHCKDTSYVESITDTVTVAAGTFNNCIRIRELAECRGSIGAVVVTAYGYGKSWYAPEVGPVIYRTYTQNWASTTLSQELASFSIVTKAMPWIPLLLLNHDRK
jgi:hypothetical protein